MFVTHTQKIISIAALFTVVRISLTIKSNGNPGSSILRLPQVRKSLNWYYGQRFIHWRKSGFYFCGRTGTIFLFPQAAQRQ